MAVLGPSGFPQQNTFHWDRLQPGEQVCSCIRAHVIHFIPVLTFSLLYLFENCVSPLTTSPTTRKTVLLWCPAKERGPDGASFFVLPAFKSVSRVKTPVMYKMECSLIWLFLHKRPPPTHISRSSLPHLSDKDTQKNIVPSRSPPDLTSRLLLIYSSVGCLCRSNQCRLRTIIRFPWSWELTGWMQR